ETIRSSLDFAGMGQLRGQAQTNSKAALRETAQQFEAMFIQMMMKSMREATPKSDLSDSSGKDLFEGMFDREVSVQMAKRNALGLADMLVKNMPDPALAASTGMAATDTAAMLQAHAAAMPLKAAQERAFSMQARLAPLAALPRPPGPMPLSTRDLPEGGAP
ncbi:MAG: rod-binding protein, partial [Rhodoferax sp.]